MVVWECRCDCGETAYRTHQTLKMGSENTSCGCLQPEIYRDVAKKAFHCVEGTIIEKLQSQKPTTRNKSGVRGVYYRTCDKKWAATIGFQKKLIYLGYFNTLEEAAKARKRAEKEIYEPFLQAYYTQTEGR
jgi:hypothetical protein